MRKDLEDAYAAIEWGGAQLPFLVEKFHAWKQAYTGIEIRNLDGGPGQKVAVFRKKFPLPPMINAGVGSVINSFRTALDLLCAALARRNGKRPSEETHFPFFRSIHDFIDPICGIENKKSFSASDIRVLKSLRAYNGGDDFLWSLHQLDILRKHERLIVIFAEPDKLILVGEGEQPKLLFSRSQPLEDETPLFQFSANAPQPETGIDFRIVINEPALPAVHSHPMFFVLGNFRRNAYSIIKRFDD